MDESKNQTERGVTLRITDLNLKYLNLSCQYNAAQNKHMDGSMCQNFILTTQVGKSVLFYVLVYKCPVPPHPRNLVLDA